MSCEQVKGQITWYLYNELDEKARAEVEDHLEACQACAAELSREQAFLSKLNARQALEPSAALVAESRHDLMRAVYRESSHGEGRQHGLRPAPHQPAWEARLGSWFSMRLWWQPTAAACLIALGFVGGWQLRNPRSSNGRSAVNSSINEASISNISGVTLDPKGGEVQISFDEVRRQTVTGKLQDHNIRDLLIYAAKSYGNPGVRMDTIDILKARADEQQFRDTLLYLVGSDTNAGVRLKALEGLKAYAKDPAVRQSLIRVLTNDDNPGMRVQAIDLLTEGQDRSLVGVLQGVADKEQNNYVRMRCREALRDMNASAETF